MADHIWWLMGSRLIQAFGGSTGSVIGQCIARDAFHGKDRVKVFASVGAAISLSPAMGPVIGGFIDQYLGWSAVFIFLILLGSIVWALSLTSLAETHHPHPTEHKIHVLTLMRKMSCDRLLIGLGLLVGGCNGISFSYYAEGSFLSDPLWGLSPSLYGISFLFVACAGVYGAWLGKKLHEKLTTETLIQYGIFAIFVGSTFFSLGIISEFISIHTPHLAIGLTLISMATILLGFGLAIPSCLAIALEHYQYALGTAGSIFGLFYYLIISLCTLLMAALRDGTLVPMPLYFLGITIGMYFSFWRLVRHQ